MDHRIRAAVENNVRWCDLVCRSHNITTSWQKGFWVSRVPTPRFYPEGITLQKNIAPEQLIGELPAGICSVKDSFADLDLASRGFDQLFEARWIYGRDAAGVSAARGWTVVRTEKDFDRWLDACGLSDILPVELLRDESVRFLQRERTNDVSAGAVLNRTGSVVGVSNVFSTSASLDEVWSDVVSLSDRHFPSCPIVGYERGEHLDAAIDAGFADLAPLRVWLQRPRRGS